MTKEVIIKAKTAVDKIVSEATADLYLELEQLELDILREKINEGE